MTFEFMRARGHTITSRGQQQEPKRTLTCPTTGNPPGCGQTLPEDQFYDDSSKTNGKKSKCRQCTLVYQKALQDRHRRERSNG